MGNVHIVLDVTHEMQSTTRFKKTQQVKSRIKVSTVLKEHGKNPLKGPKNDILLGNGNIFFHFQYCFWLPAPLAFFKTNNKTSILIWDYSYWVYFKTGVFCFVYFGREGVSVGFSN